MNTERVYPDITPLLEAKARRREALAALSWEEKIAIIERMRRLLPENAWKDKNKGVDEDRELELSR